MRNPNVFQILWSLCLSLLIFVYGVISEASVYSRAADSLQQVAHDTYISESGFYYTHDPDGGFDYWWNANALDALTQGFMRTRNEVSRQRMKKLLRGTIEHHGGYINKFYDDMEWMGLASVKAYKATGDREYLDMANLLWQDILTGRSPEYLGAISWNKECHPSCKNAISNSPAALLGAQLYQMSGNEEQLRIAKEVHAYVKNVLVTPTGGVYDEYNPITGKKNTNPDWVFSYNVGMYIAASVELYEITGDREYLNDAIKSAEHALNERMVNGVFYTNENGQGDGGLFKGIFIRSLRKLVGVEELPREKKQRYGDAIKYNAQVLLNSGMTDRGLVGPVWNSVPSPSLVLHFSTQLSGIMLFEAAASLEQEELSSLQEKVVVVSDIDDTIRATHVGCKLCAVENVQYSDRRFFAMNQLYQLLRESNPNTEFHYVTNAGGLSGGVLGLYFKHRRLLREGNFPDGTKRSHFHYRIGSSRSHKLHAISKIIEQEKPQTLIMIGDNGENDIVFYDEISRRNPDLNILQFIRVSYTDRRQSRVGQVEFVTPVEIALSLSQEKLIDVDRIEQIASSVQEKANGDLKSKDNHGPKVFPTWVNCSNFRWPQEFSKWFLELQGLIAKRCFG